MSDTVSEVVGRQYGWSRRLADRIDRRPKLWRVILAGPGALLAALLFMATMPIWLPPGDAGVNNLIFPIILAPLLWAVVFTYTCIEENLPRCAAVMGAAIVVQIAILILNFV